MFAMSQSFPFADQSAVFLPADPHRVEAEGYVTRESLFEGSETYGNSLHPDDPAYVCRGVRPDRSVTDDSTPDLASLLKSQAKLAMTMQRRVDECPDMDVKEMKDVATACSSLINGVHRTGELLRAMETYKLFHSVVIAFIRARSDSTGEDLLEELKKAADEMNVRAQVGRLL